MKNGRCSVGWYIFSGKEVIQLWVLRTWRIERYWKMDCRLMWVRKLAEKEGGCLQSSEHPL